VPEPAPDPILSMVKLGSGLITGASDDDPSGIGTYSQVGSQFGYGLLWLALFTFPLVTDEALCQWEAQLGANRDCHDLHGGGSDRHVRDDVRRPLTISLGFSYMVLM
jgi:hypothetical protein